MDRSYLSSYLPRLVRERIASEPSSWPTLNHAAILLTDMQNFTRMVEQATVGGRDQLEDLSRSINAYFSDLIDVVHAHGGDILAFAGDSLFCAWPAMTAEALPDATKRAVQAALAVQKTLVGRQPTRVGVGAGGFACTLAGGQGGRWELLTAGEAVSGAIEAEKQGQPGQVVLAPPAWETLKVDASAARLDSGCYLLGDLRQRLPLQLAAGDDAALDLEKICPLIPAAVMHRVAAGQTAWLAEVRPVTVVMISMPGVDLSKPAEIERAQRGIGALQEIFREFDGSTRFGIDSKGYVIGGDFGLPPTAQDRDAERAVRAAQRLLAVFTGMGIACGIGVATSRSLCTGFGNARRRGFGVFGDGTNLATRLMQAASNEVLCDEATMHAVRDRLEFEALAPIRVKGRENEVRAYRPGRVIVPADEAPAQMLGRRAELATLDEQIEALRRGIGGVVIVEGEAGMGKSMLLGELRRLASVQGLRTLSGSADMVDRSTAYLGWRPIFTELLGTEPDMDGDEAVRFILRRFPRAKDLAPWLPLLGPVLGLSIADTESTLDMSGEARAASTHRLMLRVLKHFTSQGPMLIAIEDAHWLDSGSRGFLRWLARTPALVLTVISTRPEGRFAEQLRASLKGPRVQTLKLAEMPPEEIRDLAGHVLGVSSLPPALDTLLRVKAGGNPYFCFELVRALLDTGRIAVRDAQCEMLGLDSGDVPATLESAILGRLGRLDAAEQLCLKAASVLGQSFHEDALRAVHPDVRERANIVAHLAAAERAGLIVADADDTDRIWSFRHAIVRDVTYALWPQEQRRPLHREAALWFESRHHDDLPPLYPLLAHHWDEAHSSELAAHYIEKAGDQALHAGAYQEGRRLFARALDLLLQDDVKVPASRRARWHAGAGMAYYFLGELGASREQLEIAVSLLDEEIPAPADPALWPLLGTMLKQTTHLARRRNYGRRAEDQANIDTAVECYTKLGQIYYLNGEPATRLMLVTIRGLNLAEQGRPSAALARSLAATSILAALAGLPGLANRYAARAQSIASLKEHDAAAPLVWHFHAILCAQRGQWAAAREANDRASNLIREVGDQTLEAEACVVRSTFLLCQGDYIAADEAWARALRLARRVGNARMECWCRLDEAESLVGRDELSRAAAVLDEALAIPTSPGDGYTGIEKQRVIALVRLRQNRPAEALAACEVVCRMVEEQAPAGYHWAEFYASAIEVMLTLLERDDDFARTQRSALLARASEACRTLRTLSKKFGNVGVRATALAAQLAWVQGRKERALRLWHDAAQQGQKLDMPFETVRAITELAARGRMPAAADLDSALQLLRERGAYEWLHKLETAVRDHHPVQAEDLGTLRG